MNFIDYIGIKWVYGKTDCWAIVKLVSDECFGVKLPDIRLPEVHDNKESIKVCDHWKSQPEFFKVNEPSPGDIVIMAGGAHVGIVVDDLKILHSFCDESGGESRINTRRALENFYSNSLEYYRHASSFKQRPGRDSGETSI